MENYVNREFQQLAFFDMVFDKSHGWFCHEYYNALFRMDMESHEINLEAVIPSPDGNGFCQYGFLELFDRKLILAPRNAKDILIYDLDEKFFERVKINLDMLAPNEIFNLFSGVTAFGKYIFFFPGRYPAIIRINMETLEVTYFNEWYQELLKAAIGYDKNRVIFARCNCICGNCIFLPYWQGNIIVEFNMKTGRYVLHRINKAVGQFSCVQYDGKYFWVSMVNIPKIIKWDIDHGILEEYNNLPEDIQITSGFSYIEEYNSSIYAVPLYGNMIIKIDKVSYRSEKIRDLLMTPEENLKRYVLAENNMLCYKRDKNDCVWFYSVFDGKIIKFNLHTLEFEEYRSIINNEEDLKQIVEMTFLTNTGYGRAYEETGKLSLERYIKYLTCTDAVLQENGNNSNGNCGYEILKNTIAG